MADEHLISSKNSDAPLTAFHYVTAEKSWLYRPLMRAFSEAKERFVLHLRLGEIASVLQPQTQNALYEIDIERALAQLCEWGNVQRHFDTADVKTVEEFNKPRFLYQITARGEAAERALRTFEESIQQPGELQATALSDIRDYLGELQQLAAGESPDEGKISQALEALVNRFEQLTSRAQTFIASIQPAVQLQAAQLDMFISYKRMLIDYLDRFVQDLVTRTVEIVARIQAIEQSGIERLLTRAVERDMADVMDPTPERGAAALARWQQRWRGLRGWFISDGVNRSQAEELRAHARAAIPALLRAVSTIHDRRVQRSDRVADLKTLARWFAAADEPQAARLWRGAFALSPARHLRVTEETLDAWSQQSVPASTSWFDAPGLHISPRLRQTGRYTRNGRPTSVIDRSLEKARLAAMALDQMRQIETARQELCTNGRVMLSSLGHLNCDAFDLFLELLGEALAKTHAGVETVEATSIDGTTKIQLTPVPDAQTVTLETPWGWFRGLEHAVEISAASYE